VRQIQDRRPQYAGQETPVYRTGDPSMQDRRPQYAGQETPVYRTGDPSIQDRRPQYADENCSGMTPVCR